MRACAGKSPTLGNEPAQPSVRQQFIGNANRRRAAPPSNRLRFINDSCPNIVSNGRLKLIHSFEGVVWLGPHSVASLRSVPCGTIFPKPCAGCGVLASVAKVLIAPICTTCADRARSGTPNTAAWPRRRTRPAALPRGSIATTHTAPNDCSRPGPHANPGTS